MAPLAAAVLSLSRPNLHSTAKVTLARRQARETKP